MCFTGIEFQRHYKKNHVTTIGHSTKVALDVPVAYIVVNSVTFFPDW